MTSVLVTGAAGFIGRSLAAHFARLKWQVFVDVATNSQPSRRPVITVSALEAACGAVVPDAIIHAAGSGTVGKVAADPARELPANLEVMVTVLEYARTVAPSARVVLLSSAALYGNAPADPQRETDTREPVSLYGVAKAQAEQLAAYYADQFGVWVTAVRLFSVYGPGLRKQLLWDAMSKFAAGGSVPSSFFGTGRERRDWVHIDDVCTFLTRLLELPPRAAFDIYNCAGSAASTSEVLSVLAQVVGAPAPGFNGQARAGDPPCLVADLGKAAYELGWHAAVPWREGVTWYARWFMDARRGAPGTPE